MAWSNDERSLRSRRQADLTPHSMVPKLQRVARPVSADRAIRLEAPNEVDDGGHVGRREIEPGRSEPGHDPGQLPEAVVLGRRDEEADLLPARVDRGPTTLADLIEDRGDPALDLGDADRPRDLENLAPLAGEPTGRRSAGAFAT